MEWLIVVALVTAVVTAATASLRTLQTSRQLFSLTQNLMADLQLARTHAIGAAQPVVFTTRDDGRGYRIQHCDVSGLCAASGNEIKVVELPQGVSLTPSRRFEFQSPRGVMSLGSQSACLTAGPSQTPLKVLIDTPLSAAQACAVGQAERGLPACTSGC